MIIRNKKGVVFSMLMAAILIQSCSVAASTVWNFRSRTNNGLTAPWGSGHRVYDDEHGNTDVWHFLYGDEGVSDPAQFKHDLYWRAEYSRWNIPVAEHDSFRRYDSTSVNMVTESRDLIIAFISPVHSVFTVNLNVESYLYSTDGQNVYLQKNEAIEKSSYISAGEIQTLTATVELEAGDVLYFRVNRRYSGSWDHFYVKNFTLTGEEIIPDPVVIPEPMSIVFLGLGIVGLLRRKMRM